MSSRIRPRHQTSCGRQTSLISRSSAGDGLSTVLDDFSRYIIAWKLCTTMKAADVTATLEMALDAAGLEKARVLHQPRLLSDNGSSYISDDLAKWLERHDMAHVRGAPYHPMTQGKDRALAPNAEEPDSAGEPLPAGRSGSPDQGLCGRLQPPPLPREHQ